MGQEKEAQTIREEQARMHARKCEMAAKRFQLARLALAPAAKRPRARAIKSN